MFWSLKVRQWKIENHSIFLQLKRHAFIYGVLNGDERNFWLADKPGLLLDYSVVLVTHPLRTDKFSLQVTPQTSDPKKARVHVTKNLK